MPDNTPTGRTMSAQEFMRHQRIVDLLVDARADGWSDMQLADALLPLAAAPLPEPEGVEKMPTRFVIDLRWSDEDDAYIVGVVEPAAWGISAHGDTPHAAVQEFGVALACALDDPDLTPPRAIPERTSTPSGEGQILGRTWNRDRRLFELTDTEMRDLLRTVRTPTPSAPDAAEGLREQVEELWYEVRFGSMSAPEAADRIIALFRTP